MLRRLARIAALTAALALPAAAQDRYDFPADPDAARFVQSNLIAVFYHELGHALIHVLLLPVLGREEDAADALSALFIHQLWEEEAALALTADTALAFRLFAERAEAEGVDNSYWGSHSLDMQRYFTLVCLVYGAAPDSREGLADLLDLPEERRAGCPDEFAMAAESWGAMLADMPAQDGGRGLRLVGDAGRDDYSRTIAAEIEGLNGEYGLPVWVDVTVERCGEANAFYDPRARRIVMCLEYAEDLAALHAGHRR
jgi:hypothetical protein